MADSFINDLFDFALVWSTFPNFDNENYTATGFNQLNEDCFFKNDTLLMQELDLLWPAQPPDHADVNSDNPPLSPSSSPSTPITPPVFLLVPKSSRRNTRVGYCEHPKHEIYRRPDYHSTPVIKQHHQHCHQLCDHHHYLLHHTMEGRNQIINTPRRGRPPKGTKPLERVYKTAQPFQMTIRPLPKRLEAVVGESNIYVCLTCLKRSDLDTDYLIHPAYVGPQSTKKKKK
ncbi:hypothetical protein BC941DRAFT_473994 [Chlamydoabsidia padenii]|nr:hypothetical protein BC941DRAFT_473994 [Chlamydoabsidia padenii]